MDEANAIVEQMQYITKPMLRKCRRQYLNSGTHMQKTNANQLSWLSSLF